MNRTTWIVLMILLPLVGFFVGARFSRWQRVALAHQSDRPVLYYVDPMNPTHTSSTPGKAPCGMDMEPVYADEGCRSGKVTNALLQTPGIVRITSEKQQVIGLQLGRVEQKTLTRTIRFLGRVAVDETRIYRINATIDGWITKTLPFASGSYVHKDETLAGFYSPEFLSAGQALLFALNSMDRVQTTGKENPGQQAQLTQFNLNLKQYRDSLRNLGMSERQIEELIRTRQYMENVDITAPADGFILLRNVSEGQRFDKGTELFRLADLNYVWILVDVYEREAGLVAFQDPVTIRLPAQDKTFTARVSQTLPQFDNVTRTLKLRLEADNRDFILKPDMYVDVDLAVRLPESLVVPSDAVLDTGVQRTVFVHQGNGCFEPRPVRTGLRLGEMVQITEGLQAGEQIVISGNFLLDSESRMKLAAAGDPKPKVRDPVCGMEVNEKKAKAAGRSSEYAGKTYFFCNAGCKKEFDTHPAEYVADTPSLVTRATDPVCGMTVNEAKARAAGRVTSYGGQSYYFCNEGCKEAFAADPEKYLKPANTSATNGISSHVAVPVLTNTAAYCD